MIKLLLADVLPLDDSAVYDGIYGRVSLERRSVADSFRFRKDRLLSLGAAALLDLGLAEFGLCEKDMSYGRTAHGKPFFKNAPDIHFSISHSSSKVAVAFSDREVGCDIEEISDIDLAVAERYFHRAEYEAIMAENGQEKRWRAFFRYWTLKESYMKATGIGLSLPVVAEPLPHEVFTFISPDSFPGYECALCYRPESGTPQVEHVKLV